MSFYKEVPGRQTTLESTLKFDTTPTEGSTNPVTSEGVKSAIDGAVGDASAALQDQIDEIAEKAGSGYTPKGEASVATLNALSGQENGELYTMIDAGTLTEGSLAVVAGDTVAWDATNEVWYKAMDYAPRQYGTNEVHNLSTTITAFRTGDVIAVDGPSGTAKMSKDSLLQLTANNALVGNLAPAFDPTKDYLAGEIVVYGGRTYRFEVNHSSGVWDANKVTAVSVKDYLVNNDAVFAYLQETPSESAGKYSIRDDGEIYETSAGSQKIQYMQVSAGEHIILTCDTTTTAKRSIAVYSSAPVYGNMPISNLVVIPAGKGYRVDVVCENSGYLCWEEFSSIPRMDAYRVRNKIPYATSEGTSADIADGNKVIVKKANETFVNVDAGLFAKKSDTEVAEPRDTVLDYHVQVSAEGLMTYDEENVSSSYRCVSFPVKLGGVYNVLVTRTSARAFRGGVYADAPTEQSSQNVIGNFQNFDSELSTSYTFTAEANGYYVVSYSRNTGNTISVSASETISIKDKLTETNEPNIDIDTIYPSEIVEPRLVACRHDKGNSFGTKTASLVLLHFSDIHADVEEISRIMQFKQKYSGYIDDVIHTGDLVRGYYGDGSLELVQEAYHFGDILQVIGNHDLAKSSTDAGHLLDPLTNVEAYNAYFKDYITNWGVTQPADAATLGKLYYYKDYPSSNSDVSKTIRLIVIDNFADSDATQQAWFSSLLDDARTNNMAVVVADHSPFGDADMVNCNFNSMTEEYRVNFFAPVNLSALVDDFIDAGGEFICWINGHHHRDMFLERGRNKQLDVSINTGCYYANLTGSARRPQGCVRMPDNYTRDCFNVIAFDPVNKVVKIQRFGSGWDSIGHKQEWLSYNYATHTIMGNG